MEKTEKKNKEQSKNSAFLYGIIAGLTVVIVAGLWFFSGGKDSVKSDELSVSSPAAVDNMADHHGGGNTPSTAALEALVGQAAPDFSFSDRNGTVYSRENLKGKKIVLFFNEGLMCYPACWNQIVQLARDARFDGSDTIALSVVVDQPADWQKAIDKMPELAEATVVFDEGGEASGRFGLLTAPSSMHYGQFPGHTYVIIDEEGIVRYVYDDPRMAINNDKLAAELK